MRIEEAATARSAPSARVPGRGGRSKLRSGPPSARSAAPRPPASAPARGRARLRFARASPSKNPSGSARPYRASTAAAKESRFLPTPRAKASSAVAGRSAAVRHSARIRAKMTSLSTRTPSQSKMTRFGTGRLSLASPRVGQVSRRLRQRRIECDLVHTNQVIYSVTVEPASRRTKARPCTACARMSDICLSA